MVQVTPTSGSGSVESQSRNSIKFEGSEVLAITRRRPHFGLSLETLRGWSGRESYAGHCGRNVRQEPAN
jgi:hypothetical protein